MVRSPYDRKTPFYNTPSTMKKTMIYCALFFVIGYAVAYFIHCKITRPKPQDFVKIIKLSVDENNDSHFEELSIPTSDLKPLGKYSKPLEVKQMYFRNSLESVYDFHPAPRQQYIIYLSGKAEIMTSKGEKRTFGAGDILLAADCTGKGHKSIILEEGQAIIVTAE
jgi:hypothetical protein